MRARSRRTPSARGTDLVYAWGGDGTVNEVGSVLAFGEAALAIVPAGSGNGLARALGIPREPGGGAAPCAPRPARRIDVGEIAGRIFLNVAGVGFDAHIASEFSREHGQRGFRRYVRIVTRELFAYSPRSCRVTIEAIVTEHRAFLLTVANGPQWGNGAIVAPGARLDDGLLDLVTVESPSRLQLIAIGARGCSRHARPQPRGHRATGRRGADLGRSAPPVPLRRRAVVSTEADLLVRVHPRALVVRA